jgi:hypothetical protein
MSKRGFRVLVAGIVGIILILVLAILVMLNDKSRLGQGAFAQTSDGEIVSQAPLGETESGEVLQAEGALPTAPASAEPNSASAATDSQEDAPETTHSETVEPDATPEEVAPLSGGLTHTGVGSGRTPLAELPPDVYRVFLTSEGAIDVFKPIVEEGSCSQHLLFAGLTGPFQGSATYRSTGCLVRFELGGDSGSWTVVVEPASEGGVLSVPVTLNGDSPRTSGLVDLPEGDYRLEFVTESPYSLVIPIVVNGPCLERPIFVLSGPGTFETTYESRGCEIVFQVSKVTAEWKLAVLSGPGA